MTSQQNYLLATHEEGMKRLSLQHALFLPASERLLLSAGLKGSLRVLELACGPGFMTKEMSKHLVPTAKLIAFDNHPGFVEQTKLLCHDIKQISVHELDAFDMEELGQEFDLIYCRMLLHHLPEPEKIIAKAWHMLRPGGALVCEEPPSIDGTELYPHSKAFTEFIALVLELFDLNHSEYRIAYTMPRICESLGFKLEAQALSRPILVGDYRHIHLMTFKEFSVSALEKGVVTQDYLDNLYSRIATDLKQADFVPLFGLHQLIARKPKQP